MICEQPSSIRVPLLRTFSRCPNIEVIHHGFCSTYSLGQQSLYLKLNFTNLTFVLASRLRTPFFIVSEPLRAVRTSPVKGVLGELMNDEYPIPKLY